MLDFSDVVLNSAVKIRFLGQKVPVALAGVQYSTVHTRCRVDVVGREVKGVQKLRERECCYFVCPDFYTNQHGRLGRIVLGCARRTADKECWQLHRPDGAETERPGRWPRRSYAEEEEKKGYAAHEHDEPVSSLFWIGTSH